MELAGRYFDGASLEPIPVQVTLSYDRLVIANLDGQALSVHPNKDIILLFAATSGDRVDLGVRDCDDLRLMLEVPAVRRNLSAYLPNVAGPVRGDGWAAASRVSAWLVGILLMLGLLYWQLDRLAPIFIPDGAEKSLGRELATSFVEGFGGRCTNPEAEKVLDKLVARLASNPEFGDKVNVLVAKNERVNALALPGGQIILFDGLLQQAASADEVAGVLAHEMGHEVHKHSLRGLIRALGFQFVSILLTGSDVAQLSEQIAFLAHNRSMETEADQTALEILRLAEIDTRPLATFFDRIAAQKSSTGIMAGIESFLSTHPDSKSRAHAIRQIGVTPTRPSLEAADWQTLQQVCG